MMTTGARQALQIATSLVLIGLLLWWIDLGAVVRLYAAADARLLAAGLLVAVADRAMMIAKWIPLMRVQGLPIPVGRATRVYLASNFASLFLPTSVGADVLRAVAVGRPYGATMKVAASIAMERVLGLLGLGLVLAISIPLVLSGTDDLGGYAVLAGASIAAVLVLAALPFAPGVGRRTRPLLQRLRDRPILGHVVRLGDAYAHYRNHPGLLAGIGFASAVEQLAAAAIYGLVALALGIEIGILPVVVAATLAQLLGRLPVSVSGVGVEEGAAVLFLGLFGLDPSSALSLALGRRVLESSVFVVGALFWSDLAGARNGTGAARAETAAPEASPTEEVSTP